MADTLQAFPGPKESSTEELVPVNVQLPGLTVAESSGAYGQDRLCVIQEQGAGSMEMSGQHLASISDSATDILAVSPETFKLWVLNCWGTLALWLSLPVGTER